MNRFRPSSIMLPFLLAGMVLSGCDTSQPPPRNEITPAGEAPWNAIEHPVTDSPPSGMTAGIPDVQHRSAAALRLDIDETTPEKQRPVEFTPYHKPDWLDADYTGVEPGTAPGIHPAIPDLFERPAGSKPFSVEGELLLDEGEDGGTPRVEGAGLSLEFRTD